MKVILDIECNSLDNPTKIWLIVCKDIDTGEVHVFKDMEEFKKVWSSIEWVCGHNILGYDLVHINNLLGLNISIDKCIDTLILSKLINFERKKHSLKDYGEEFGYPKIEFNDWSKYTKEMEEYCIRDVEINYLIYLKYKDIIEDKDWNSSILLEHQFQLIVNDLHTNGFYFNKNKAEYLLNKVTEELKKLDSEILSVFPPRLKFVKEIHPRITKYGTLNKSDFRWYKDTDLSVFNGGPFCRCVWEEFNPASHKQVIDVLNQAGWQPTDKTETHKDVERSLSVMGKNKNFNSEIGDKLDKLDKLKQYGWKINENNLSTLPDSAPSPARLLAKRILYESRRRTLQEWLSLVNPQSHRIHGNFYGIGAWTHRMSHQNPNTANIPKEFDEQGRVKLLGKEMRQLWCAPKGRLLVGVDAESIQLRIFAHYIDEPEFTESIVRGRKDDQSDPHSLNKRILGSVCRSRNAAKRFIYALLLGAGLAKLAEILQCSLQEAEEALDRLMERYQGFKRLKQSRIPRDAKRGYFIGLDGRKVAIPGDTEGSRRHLAMSGYLQNGEAIIMKRACVKFYPKLKELDAKLVNFVHDEWQTEVPNDIDTAIKVAKIQAEALREVGEELKLKCPMSGSYWNDDLNDYTIGTNWYQTH